MKKSNLIYVAALGLMALACNKENEFLPDGQDINLVQKTFYTGTEESAEESKVAFSKGFALKWEEGDQVMVVTKEIAKAFNVTNIKGNCADITGYTQADASEYYGIYPAASMDPSNAWTADGRLIVTIPSEQTAVHGSFDPKAYVAAAKAEGDHFSFKPLITAIRFQLGPKAADVAQVVFKGYDWKSYDDHSQGKKELNMAGKGVLATTNLTAHTYASGISTSSSIITLNAPADGFKAGTDYYIIFRNNNCDAGVEFTFTLKDGSTYVATSEKALYDKGADGKYPGKSNKVKNLGTLDYTQFTKVVTTPLEDYNNGKAISVAGKEITMKTYGTATEISTNNYEIGTDGVFFINEGVTGTKITKTNGFSKLIVISNGESHADLSWANQVRFGKNATIAMKGITIAEFDNDMIVNNINATDNGTGLYFEACKITLPTGAGKTFVHNAAGRTFGELKMHSCDVKVRNNNQRIALLAGTEAPVSTAEFIDNIFYSESAQKQFHVFEGKDANLSDLSICNNSFINTYLDSNSGYATAKNLTNSLTVIKNILELGEYKTIINQNYRTMYRGSSDASAYPATYEGTAGYFYEGEGDVVDQHGIKDSFKGTGIKTSYPKNVPAYSSYDFTNGVFTKNSNVNNISSYGAAR